ncbi:YiiX/YebB-like N1pC/P60 family cysteine hydrolase [Maribacter sp. BPC-D8]|uniref:hypothetical protein n=1 Tax=Maribacter sp. BPC-D8 TaxID=3053613 RepID=UPI002B489BE2|nr:hypothetical protein [Maribacter sp. BPC-D8]WRI27879.1 YiiX/YebB-like N1pC/P60 family cysteine hydrolase [Maribacter sp. BPC-D8]
MACSYRVKKIIFLITLTIFYACQERSEKIISSESFIPDKLESGLLICRLGNGYFSKYFKNYGSKEKKYSHIGMLSIENDSLFVYHSDASEFTGVGLVKKENFNSFVKGIKTYDYFELKFSNSIKEKILDEVKKYYKAKTPFDLEFNSENDDELYCTELIAVSVNNVFDSIKVFSPSISLKNRKIYALDDIYLNQHVVKFLP